MYNQYNFLFSLLGNVHNFKTGFDLSLYWLPLIYLRYISDIFLTVFLYFCSFIFNDYVFLFITNLFYFNVCKFQIQ